MKLFKFIILILYFTSHILFSQQLFLKGKIIDKITSKPLVGANILIISTKIGTTSDKDGEFTLGIKRVKLSDKIEISFMGYKSIITTIKKAQNTTVFEMEPRPLELGEKITIFAKRDEIANNEIVTTVSEISPLQIKQFNTSEVSDIFKAIPAVRIEGNDISGRSIQIWGSNPDEVNVYLDGILLNSLGIKNQADLSIIPLEKIEKIDVHKGANLTLLGQGAFGGVVNIKSEENNDFGLSFKSKIGNYESKFILGQLSIPIWNKLILNYSGQYSEMKPEIEYFPGEKYAPKSLNNKIDTKKQNHFLGISYYGKAGKVSAKMLNYNLNYSKQNWEDNNNNFLFSLAYNGNIGRLKNFDIYVNHFYNQEKIKRIFSESTTYNTNYFSNRTNVKIAKKITFKKQNHLQLLTEYYHDDLNSSLIVHDLNHDLTLNKTLIYDNRAAMGGIFTFTDQHEEYPFINWNTFIGVRQDFIASGESEFTKSIGTEVNVDRSDYNFSFYCNYGSNVKFPTLLEKSYIENYEIITPSLNSSSQDTLSQKIKPEYISSYQFGLKNKFKQKNSLFKTADVNVVFFYNMIYNKLLKRPFDEFIIQTQMGRNT
ncbi:MAG: TonB-dependent receptor, partial [Calditrichia bacterium]|nr:TonB-dependent receptor [Calditrichia bacterium]